MDRLSDVSLSVDSPRTESTIWTALGPKGDTLAVSEETHSWLEGRHSSGNTTGGRAPQKCPRSL